MPTSLSSAVTSPIAVLPPELLTDIFICLLWSVEGRKIKEQRGTLSLVCRLWRDIVAFTPSFWTIISTSERDYRPPFDGIKRVIAIRKALEKAGPEAALTLDASYPTRHHSQSLQLAKLVRAHSQRWIEIRLDGVMPGDFFRAVEWNSLQRLRLSNAYRRDASVPYSNCLRLSGESAQAAKMPKLRELAVTGDISDWDLAVIPGAKSISLSGSGGSTIATVLNQSPCTEQLCLTDVELGLAEALTSQAITLNYLRELQVGGLRASTTLFLLLEHVPSLPALTFLHLDFRKERLFKWENSYTDLLCRKAGSTLTSIVLYEVGISSAQMEELLIGLPSLRSIHLSNTLDDLRFLKKVNEVRAVPKLEKLWLRSTVTCARKSGVIREIFESFTRERGFQAVGEQFLTNGWSLKLRYAELVFGDRIQVDCSSADIVLDYPTETRGFVVCFHCFIVFLLYIVFTDTLPLSVHPYLHLEGVATYIYIVSLIYFFS